MERKKQRGPAATGPRCFSESMFRASSLDVPFRTIFIAASPSRHEYCALECGCRTKRERSGAILRRCSWAVLGVLFAAGLAVPQASAQGIKLGVKGGVNVAKIGGGDLAEFENDIGASTDNKTGLVAGAFAEFMIGNLFAIQPEVLYSQKGAKASPAGDEYKLKGAYVEIPVLLKINIPIEGSKVHPHVYAGPAVGFKASCKVSGTDVNADCESQEVETLLGFPLVIASTDFGVAFGGGVSVDVGGAEVGVDVRYTLGLTSIDDEVDPYHITNKVISIMGTVGFSR